MKNVRLALAVGLGIAALAVPAFAAGLWPNFPIVGGASYCASSTTAGVPGTATNCTNTVPAGPSVTGNEQVPADTRVTSGGGASSVLFKVTAFGAGALSDVTTVATATIPANTPYYMLDGAQGSAFTITMPASPNDGDVQRIFCTAATVGVMTVAANTGQSLKNNPAAACTAGVGYAWVYHAANTTWYRSH